MYCAKCKFLLYVKVGCLTTKLRKWSPRFLRFFSFHTHVYSILHVSLALAFSLSLSFTLFITRSSIFLPRSLTLFKIWKICIRINKFKLITCHVEHAQIKRQALVDIRKIYTIFSIRWDVEFSWTRQFVGRTTLF